MGQLEPKLADFGLATLEETAKNRSFVGSLAYSAPETLLGEGCSQRSDIWSMGVLLFGMLSGISIVTQ